MQLNQLTTVRQLAQRNPDALSEGTIRWHLFNAKANGLEQAGAIHRVGRKMLIDEPRYIAWLVSNPALRKVAT